MTYIPLTEPLSVQESSSESTQNVFNKETASSQTDGTTYYYMDLEDYRYVSIQIENTAGAAGTNTYTLEGTVQNDGTAQASCDYQDVTVDLTGSSSYTSDDIIFVDTVNKLKYLRIKIVRSADGGNNDGAWTIYTSKAN